MNTLIPYLLNSGNSNPIIVSCPPPRYSEILTVTSRFGEIFTRAMAMRVISDEGEGASWLHRANGLCAYSTQCDLF
jgi:hypothetical protein